MIGRTGILPDRAVPSVAASSETGSLKIGYGPAARSGPAARAAGFRLKIVGTAQSESVKEVAPQPAEVIMNKLKYQCVSRRIRFRDFFLDFDGLHSGYVSEAYFRSALGISGVSFHENELLALLEKFRNPSVPDRIHYAQMCSILEEVHVTPHLEKDPLRPVPAVGEGVVRPEDNTVQVSAEEKAYVMAIVDRFRRRSAARRITTLETLFRPTGDGTCFDKPFDPLRKGFVTRAKFLRTLQLLDEKWSNATEEEVDAVCHYYAHNGTPDVNYMRFCADVTPHGPLPPIPAVRQTVDKQLRLQKAAGPRSVDAVEEKIMSIVFKNRIRVREFFRDFDKLRAYTCSERAFQSALSMAKIDLTAPELEVLFERYRNGSGFTQNINYDAFLQSIERVDTIKELEKTPLREYATMAPNPAARPVTCMLPEAENENLSRLMSSLSEVMHKTRMNLRPAFVERDLHHSGRVTKWRFRQILTLHKINLNDAEFELLYTKYGHGADIDFYLFLNDLHKGDDVRQKVPTQDRFVASRALV